MSGELNTARESDEDFRVRIISAYGLWGAFLTAVMEASGKALDDCGEAVGLVRR